MDIKSITTRPLTRTLAVLGLAITATTAAPLLHAQGLEEVIVTATKRAVGLQDVPIAISVMSGQKIQEQGITELEDLALFMPNVHIAEGGGRYPVIYPRGRIRHQLRFRAVRRNVY